MKSDPCLLGKPEYGLRATMPVGVDCPLNCKHCYQEGSPREKIDFETSIKSLVKMGLGGVNKLYWDGAEPMTNKDLPLYLETINHLKDFTGNQSFQRVSIATNGLLVTKDKAQKLYDKGLRNIMVSVDGATAETHDSFRNNGSYDGCLKAIEILKEVGYDIRIGTTIWSGNMHQLDDIVELGQNLGVKEVAFNWMQPVGNALKYPDLMVPNYFFQAISDVIDDLQEKSSIKVGFHRKHDIDETKICSGGERIIYVSGEYVYPCSWMSVASPEFKSTLTLNDSSLKKILEEDPMIQSFKELVKKRSIDGAVCPALCKIYNGKFSGPDPLSSKGIHKINQKSLK